MLGSADSTELQHIHQSKDVVQSPLRIQEDKITCPGFSERIAEVPVKSASLLPLSMFDVKVEEMDKTTADSVASIEDCLSLFLNDVLEWRCDNCSKVNNEMSANQSKNSEHMVASMEETTTVEQSDRTTCKNNQSSGSDSLSVKSKSSSSRQPHGSEAQRQIIQTDKVTGRTNLGHHSEDISMQTKMYLERKMQTELGHSAYQLEDNRNEKKDRNGSAVQRRRFVNLPPVLTLHLKRSITPELKISDHVRYKEYLDVEPFMDPRYYQFFTVIYVTQVSYGISFSCSFFLQTLTIPSIFHTKP
jgi:ubiquitin carboxyl-terminal hydrolase 16/45